MHLIKNRSLELSDGKKQSKSTFWIPVGAACLLSSSMLLGSEVSLASTGSSWSQKNTWTADEPAHRSTTKDFIKESKRDDVSPFGPGSHNLAVDLGQVFLMGGLTKYADSIGAQLHYTYGVSELFAFDASAGYSEHSDGQYSMTSVLAGMRMNMSWYDRVIPYAVFGLGFYKPSLRNSTATSSSPGSTASPGDTSNLSALLFGLHLGPGVDLELSRNLFFGASLTFHNMFGANGTPNLGGTFTSFLLHAGVTF